MEITASTTQPHYESTTRPEYHQLYRNKAYSFVRGVVDGALSGSGQCSQCAYYDITDDIGEDVCPKRDEIDSKDSNCLICNDDLTGVWREMKLYPMKDSTMKDSTTKEKQPTGVKYDSLKTDWAYLTDNFIPELENVIKVLEYGNTKYPADDRSNWKRVDNFKRRYSNAAMRHIVAYLGGEQLDKETGYNHLHHAITNLLFILNKERTDNA